MLASAQGSIADVLASAGDMASAKSHALEGLRLWERITEHPSAQAYEFFGYGEALLSERVPELRDPHAARAAMLRAAQLTDFRNPKFLQRLAVACAADGDPAAAGRWLEYALIVLPAEDYRVPEFKDMLEHYRGKVSGPTGPTIDDMP